MRELKCNHCEGIITEEPVSVKVVFSTLTKEGKISNTAVPIDDIDLHTACASQIRSEGRARLILDPQ